MTTVVNVRTQEQWDFVTKYYRYEWRHRNSKFSCHGDQSCINIKMKSRGSLESSSRLDYDVLTFTKWRVSVGMFMAPIKELKKHKI